MGNNNSNVYCERVLKVSKDQLVNKQVKKKSEPEATHTKSTEVDKTCTTTYKLD